MHTAGGSMGEGMGDAASVADDIQTVIAAFELVADLNFHVVELDQWCWRAQ